MLRKGCVNFTIKHKQALKLKELQFCGTDLNTDCEVKNKHNYQLKSSGVGLVFLEGIVSSSSLQNTNKNVK